jgi:hypothetical protein
MGRKRKALRGIRKHVNGFEVNWRDGEGKRHFRRFPLGTPHEV